MHVALLDISSQLCIMVHVVAPLTSTAAHWPHANNSERPGFQTCWQQIKPCLDSKVLSNGIQDELDLLLSWLRLHCYLTAAICMQTVAGIRTRVVLSQRMRTNAARNGIQLV